jgi:uncharacterized lipoprotein NlpE involved in copper resistance
MQDEKITRTTTTREAHTTATEDGTTIPAHDKTVKRDGESHEQHAEAEGDRVTERTTLKEAHSTATEAGTTIPAHDRLVPKSA